MSNHSKQIGYPVGEFNPASETHHPLVIIKAVEPGCTTELQLELITGEVRRFTTTEDPDKDDELFEQQIIKAFKDAWKWYAVQIGANN